MCVKERVVTKLNLGKLMAASKICAFLIYARRKMTSRVGKSKLIFTAVLWKNYCKTVMTGKSKLYSRKEFMKILYVLLFLHLVYRPKDTISQIC